MWRQDAGAPCDFTESTQNLHTFSVTYSGTYADINAESSIRLRKAYTSYGSGNNLLQ